MVKNWFSEFKPDCTSPNGEPRTERPKMATTANMIGKIHRNVLDNRRVNVRNIVDIVYVLNDRCTEF